MGKIEPGLEDLLSSYPTSIKDGSAPAEATPEPEYQPTIPQGSGDQNLETANAGAQEYSVEATNFNCICSVDGNITPTFGFQDDHLIFNNDQVYEKVGENT